MTNDRKCGDRLNPQSRPACRGAIRSARCGPSVGNAPEWEGWLIPRTLRRMSVVVRRHKVCAAVLAIVMSTSSSALDAQESMDPLCSPLRAFVSSVAQNETREFTFHTSWGGAFKDAAEDTAEVMYARRCTHGGYEPAKAVCGYLMEYGAVEFSGINAKRVIGCLSPGTTFANRMHLDRVVLRFDYGTDDVGANVTVSFLEDVAVGGMALRVTADGY